MGSSNKAVLFYGVEVYDVSDCPPEPYQEDTGDTEGGRPELVTQWIRERLPEGVWLSAWGAGTEPVFYIQTQMVQAVYNPEVIIRWPRATPGETERLEQACLALGARSEAIGWYLGVWAD